MAVSDLVTQINEAEKLYSVYDVEDEVLYGLGAQKVATIEPDEHRWYTIATVVYQIGDEFLGVRGPVALKSESMGYNDVEVECTAFEMEPVPSVTYRPKL